jgi:zinc and cadmium transporter
LNPAPVLALYTLLIAAAALASAAVPVLLPRLQARAHYFLSFAAGVMLGAAFFHMLPEAVATGGIEALPWALGGFVFLFSMERYVLIHWCKEDESCEVHGGDHHHAGTMGLAALLGLSVHTIVDGFALGAAVAGGVGTSAFLAILSHKVPNSFSLASILVYERYARRTVAAYMGIFVLTLPLGAILYFLLSGALSEVVFGARALAFSAGTFLHLAVSDLIPDLHRYKDQRLGLSLTLIGGIGLMFLADFLAH